MNKYCLYIELPTINKYMIVNASTHLEALELVKDHLKDVKGEITLTLYSGDYNTLFRKYTYSNVDSYLSQ